MAILKKMYLNCWTDWKADLKLRRSSHIQRRKKKSFYMTVTTPVTESYPG